MPVDYGNAILSGLLGGIGVGAQSLAAQNEQQRRDVLERDRLAQERDLRQQVIDQQAAQFQATQAAAERDKYVQPNDLAVLSQVLGLKTPLDTMGPSPVRIPTSVLPAYLTQAAKQQDLAREQALLTQTADFMTRAKGQPGQPAELLGQLAEGEDPEAAALIPRSANVPGVPAMSKWDVAAGLTGLGHKDAGIKSLLDLLYPANKFAPLPQDSPGLFNTESGVITEIPRPPEGTMGGAPPETPGLRNVQSTDAKGRVIWKQEPISVGADREGEAAARGYRSFAEAPTPVQREINAALDTQGLRRAQQQGVEAAKLNAKPLTEDEAKSLAASTAALGAVGEINRFSPEQIGKYVGVLNKPLAEAQQILAGATGGAADENFIAFKMANARLQATMFDIAGKAVTETEKKVVTSYIPTGDEPNAAAYLAKLRGFEAYTRAARDTKLELTRTGRGAVTPADYDQRLLEALGKGRRDGLPASAPPPAGGSAGGGWKIQRVQ